MFKKKLMKKCIGIGLTCILSSNLAMPIMASDVLPEGVGNTPVMTAEEVIPSEDEITSETTNEDEAVPETPSEDEAAPETRG